MSTQNIKTQEEVELGSLFAAIKKIIKYIALLLYKFVRFIIRSWAILLALLIIGLVAGYFWQQNYKGKKEAELIIRTNFNSTNYVYSAIDQLNKSTFGEDYPEEELPEIVKLEIEPIVNIEALFEDFRNEMAVIDLVEIFQDKTGQYSPEAFIPRYNYHRLKVIFNQDASPESIVNLMNHLRNNPLLQEISEVGLQNLQQRVIDNQQMVRQIDEVLARVSAAGEASNANLMILGGNGSLQLAEILDMKKELLEENDEIRENILAQQEMVVLINNPRLTIHNSFIANKILWLPFLLIFSYMFIFFLGAIYRKMERIAKNQKQQ